ncbi:MAG: hypothetical protein HY717_06650 [Planctomycetes bacterium]|nr:hypothetical protein [Planctomycetota bacterium]
MIGLGAFWPPWALVRAQPAGLTLELTPAAAAAEVCSQAEVRLAVKLSNPQRLPVGGYQLFLRFPAAQVTLTAYEPDGIAGAYAANGPAPFGRGFAGCELPLGDPWDDGKREDVFSLAASVYGEATGEPLTREAATLGTVAFQVRDQAPAGEAAFSIAIEGCSGTVGQFTGVFDPQGKLVPASFLRPVAKVQLEAPLLVQNLTCSLDDQAQGVRLRWDPPGEGKVEGYAVYRNGERIAAVALASIHEFLDAPAPPGPVEYAIAVVVARAERLCRAQCRLDLPGETATFIRGDANHDGRRNISDPILILSHLFAGTALSCPDGADFDDSGSLDVTDAILLLGFLFNRGEPPPPPSPEPGTDPTADALGCN